MKRINFLKFLIPILVLIIYLIIIFIITIFLNKTLSSVIRIWAILFIPFLIVIVNSKRDLIMRKYFNIQENNLVIQKSKLSGFKKFIHQINNLSYIKAFILLIVWAIIVYIILSIVFKISLDDLRMYGIIIF